MTIRFAARTPVLVAVLTIWSALGPLSAAVRAQDAVEAPPHVLRLDGSGAQVTRDGAATVLDVGEPFLFGDQLSTGDAYVQWLWSDGSRVALDRDVRAEAVSPTLLALTAGRAIVTRPAAITTPLRLDTPAASVALDPDGQYHVLVADDQGVTVGVSRGRASIQVSGRTHVVEAGRALRLRGDGTAGQPEAFSASATGSFDVWASAEATSRPGRPLESFADPRVEAYSDVFNRDGVWETDPRLGAIWYPAVGPDWRPYASGYWQPYGDRTDWLWVGRDAWSWPTHHYGRWGMNATGRWYWTPGREWAPAWVHWSVGPGYVGWSPLDQSDRPVAGWDEFTRAGQGSRAYRGWTVVPSERFGQRSPMGPYAVDPRTVPGLSTFVTQRVGPQGRPMGRPAYVAGPRGVLVGPTPRGMGPAPAPEDPYQRAAPQMPRPKSGGATSGTTPPTREPDVP